MAITLKDVAEKAGVSTSAVSRTYTQGASVSPKTRAKVEEAARTLGYRPNVLASSLTTGRTKLVGLVSDNFHNPIFLEVFDRFTRALQDSGFRPLLVNLSDETEPENSVRLLQQYSVDAAIVASSTLPVGFAQGFQDAGVPVVHSFGRHVEHPSVHVLGIDNIAAGKLAAQTLLDHGYTRIAMMAGPESATSTQDRVAGFLEVMQAQTQATHTLSYASAYSFEAGRTEMTRLLADDPAQAYFCGDDVLTIGALSAAQAKGLRVPADLGLIGVNDMQMAGWEIFNLTTIRNPIDRIVADSIDLLEGLLGDTPQPPQARLYACELIERGTLRPL